KPRASRITSPRFVDTVETLEHTNKICRGNARACVAHIDSDLSSRNIDEDAYCSARPVIEDRIIDEIGQSPQEPRTVDFDFDRRALQFGTQIICRQQVLPGLHLLLDGFPEVESLL